MNRLLFFVLLIITCSAGFSATDKPGKSNARVIAFPGAEGYGRFTTGGRGGQVLKVTNLKDHGKGSFRAAIEAAGPRIIVFDVSGTIALKSRLDINHGDVTIAGQSAPGDGICIKNYPLTVNADNVIIRYLRVRLGDEKKQEEDAMGGRQQKNVMIDHCSISWSVDECASFYTNEDFTMQWCIVSESLNSSAHHKGNHGYGAIWGGNYTTFHHNLLANHLSRNPRFSGSKYDTDIPNRKLDYANNVIYNWAGNSAYGNEEGEVNIINNYYKPGPATPEKLRERIVNPSDPYGKFYVSGNYVDGAPEVNKNNWQGGVQCEDVRQVYQSRPFSATSLPVDPAEKAYDLTLQYAGASLQRDAVDQRIVNEVKDGKATYNGSVTGMPGIIDSQNDVGGWPELKATPPSPDTDGDGMPDGWESKHGLNPNDASDAQGHQLDADYDNIEVYLNSLVADITAGQGVHKYDFVVAADGSGDYTTIQSAIDAVPNMRRNETVIFIKPGTYKEKLVLPASKTNVTFLAKDNKKTIITYDDYASKKEFFWRGNRHFWFFWLLCVWRWLYGQKHHFRKFIRSGRAGSSRSGRW
ncbi:pectinesterase family protein [Fulvivirga maritima]|uniref:pectinesterase family protein n=1 Tax=Fulvivirga maritima TaxID=2904247 RepID=UPI00279539DE|nr:pectinesterase family protein [Fulvivirga maritima]